MLECCKGSPVAFACPRVAAAWHQEQTKSIRVHLPSPREQELADPRQFSGLAAEHRRAVLLGLWYALNWCRELANCFATQLQPDGWVVGGYCGMDGWACVEAYSHPSRMVQRFLLSLQLPALLLPSDAPMCLMPGCAGLGTRSCS